MTKKALITLIIVLSISGFLTAASCNKVADEAQELIAAGKYDQAMAIVDSCLTLSPTEFKLLRAKGDIYYAQNDFENALTFYEAAVSEKSKDPESLYGAGMAALKLGQQDKAMGYFQDGLKRGKMKEKFYVGIGMTQMEKGELAEADATIRKALNKDKENPELLRLLGDINFRKQVWSIALSSYNDALKYDSSMTDLHYNMGIANKWMQNFTEAARRYREYVKFYPDDDSAWMELAVLYKLSNNPAEAIYCYKELTKHNPESGELWFTLGEIQFDARDYSGAGESLEKAVSLDYKAAESYKMLAKIYQLNKEYFKADSAYTRFEKELGAPEDPEYWFDKGKVMIKIGQMDVSFFDRAKEAFDKAIALDSSNAAMWEYGGLARYYKQEYAAAIPYFQKRIELGDESVNALRNIAFCYLKTERYDMAAAKLEEALKLKLADPVMSKMVGKIYVFRMNDENARKAIGHLKTALADESGELSNSDKCEMRGDVGYSYLFLREAKNALTYLEPAASCAPNDVGVLMNLASAYHLDQQIKKANEFYQKVLDIDPDNKEAREGYLRTKTRE